MALNASIFGNMLAQPKSPEEYLAERQQLEQGKMANMLNRQKLDEYSRGVERQGQLRNLLATGADSNALRQSGFLQEADDWDKNAAEAGLKRSQALKAEADAQQTQLKAASDRLGMIYNAASGAKDQQSYSMARAGLQAAGIDVSAIPEMFDPAYVENAKTQALTQMQRLEAAMRQAQQAEAMRHNKATEGIQAGNLAVSQANLKLSRERLSFEQGGGVDGGGASQAGLVKQYGKPPAGYRWKPDGSMEFVPGGPADQKAQLQKSGEGTVGSVVADLRDKYRILDSENAIVSENNKWGTNIGARIGSSGVGQMFGGAVGTKAQSARDSIAMTRPLLLQSIMKATGMSAKQMDSNAELKMYLATATDPTLGFQANMEALDRIEALYGGGSQQPPANKVAPKPAAPTGRTVVRTGTMNGRKVVQYSDGSTEYAD